jgi:hypothetical protein
VVITLNAIFSPTTLNGICYGLPLPHHAPRASRGSQSAAAGIAEGNSRLQHGGPEKGFSPAIPASGFPGKKLWALFDTLAVPEQGLRDLPPRGKSPVFPERP